MQRLDSRPPGKLCTLRLALRPVREHVRVARLRVDQRRRLDAARTLARRHVAAIRAQLAPLSSRTREALAWRIRRHRSHAR